MMLAAGTRLGPYEILSPISAGGMGEVYRRSARSGPAPFGRTGLRLARMRARPQAWPSRRFAPVARTSSSLRSGDYSRRERQGECRESRFLASGGDRLT